MSATLGGWCCVPACIRRRERSRARLAPLSLPYLSPNRGKSRRSPSDCVESFLTVRRLYFLREIRLWRASSRGCGQRARYSSNLCGDANFHGSGACYRDWPRCRLHSPSAERMAENAPVTPSARTVQTQKKIPTEL